VRCAGASCAPRCVHASRGRGADRGGTRTSERGSTAERGSVHRRSAHRLPRFCRLTLPPTGRTREPSEVLSSRTTAITLVMQHVLPESRVLPNLPSLGDRRHPLLLFGRRQWPAAPSGGDSAREASTGHASPSSSARHEVGDPREQICVEGDRIWCCASRGAKSRATGFELFVGCRSNRD